MVKEYYEILGVSETETLEEIKKVYRKLALKWHPDKWGNKSLQEKEEANKKMREVNKAFEILGDEEKRRRYDLGETDFSEYDDSQQKSAWEAKEEQLKKEQETLEKIVENNEERSKLLEKIWLINTVYLDRSTTYNLISEAMLFSFPRVYKEDLDPVLWHPYKDWLSKLWEMPITIIREEKERSDELKNFKEEMVKAIKEAEIAIKIREENKKKTENNSELNQARKDAFGYIEREMTYKNLKNQDLGEYSNYQERINSLSEVEEIRDFREGVLGFISKLTRKESSGTSGTRREDNYHLLSNYHPLGVQTNYWLLNDDSSNFLSGNPRPRESSSYPSLSSPNQGFLDKADFLKTGLGGVSDRRDELWDRVEEDKTDNFLSGIRDSKYDNWTHQELVDEIKRGQLNNASLHKSISSLEIKNSKQIGNQLIGELKKLSSYLSEENGKFSEWKEKISQLLKERIIGEEERKLISEIVIEREGIIKVLGENIREKKENLQKIKSNSEEKAKEVTKKSKKFLNISNLFEGSDNKNWVQENLEEVCQAQVRLTKSEIGLETVKEILERIETCKEKLEQQLEARIEVFPKK